MLVQECLTNSAQLVPFYAINNEIHAGWEQSGNKQIELLTEILQIERINNPRVAVVDGVGCLSLSCCYFDLLNVNDRQGMTVLEGNGWNF